MFHNMSSLFGPCVVWVLEAGRKRILAVAAYFSYGIIPSMCSRIRKITIGNNPWTHCETDQAQTPLIT